MRHRRSGGGNGSGTLIGVILVLALLAGGGYWLWQKQARGEISISVANAFQTERRVTWAQFAAMLNNGGEKGTVVVQAMALQVDDAFVTVAPPTETMRTADGSSLRQFPYDPALRDALNAQCGLLKPTVVDLKFQMPSATLVGMPNQ